MLMTTTKLVLLRLYNLSLGRYAWGGAFLKALLIKKLISNRQTPYAASSRFFDPRELD
jgi:hypothetical protein